MISANSVNIGRVSRILKLYKEIEFPRAVIKSGANWAKSLFIERTEMYCTGIMSEIMRFYALIIHSIGKPKNSSNKRRTWIYLG